MPLLTRLALFSFDRTKGRFGLRSIHPAHTLEEVKDATGFTFDHEPHPATTPDPDPDPETLGLLRGRVVGELAEAYPDFAARLAAEAGASEGSLARWRELSRERDERCPAKAGSAVPDGSDRPPIRPF
jgi:hypothetical protein